RGDAIKADVDANPIEPRAERRLPFEIPQAPERAEEYVLRQIARVFVVADETIAELIHSPAMTLDDEIEGTRTSSQAGAHEISLAEVCQRGIPHRDVVVSHHRQFPARICRSDDRRCKEGGHAFKGLDPSRPRKVTARLKGLAACHDNVVHR